MTTREQIDAKHKELFGRKGRKDYRDEQLLEKIKAKDPSFSIEEDTVEEEAAGSLPTVEEDTPKPEAPKSKPKPANKVIEPAKHGEETDEVGNLLQMGKEFLWYLDGEPRYNTKNVLELAIKQYGNRVSIPKGSKYQAAGTDSKCIDC